MWTWGMSKKRFKSKDSGTNNYFSHKHGFWPPEKHILCAPKEFKNHFEIKTLVINNHC